MKELRILSGCKKSVSFILDDEPVKIGSALTSELVVQDKELVSEHVEISLDEKGNVRLNPLKGSVRNVRGVVSRKPMTLKEGVPFQLGLTWFVVQNPNKPWPKRLPKLVKEEPSSTSFSSKLILKLSGLNSQKVMLQGLLVALVFIGINTFAVSKQKPKLDYAEPVGLVGNADEVPQTALKQLAQSVTDVDIRPVSKATAMTTNPTPPMPLVDDPVKIIRAMLGERELHDIGATLSNGKVTITGRLDATEKMVLSRTLFRYEREYPHLPSINDATRELVKELPFSIASIVTGSFGHITTRDGQRMSVGQSKQGFTLVAIKEGLLTFEGEQRVEVKW